MMDMKNINAGLARRTIYFENKPPLAIIAPVVFLADRIENTRVEMKRIVDYLEPFDNGYLLELLLKH
jgi:hypothetical protein